MAKDFQVDANYRFIAAYQEVNARINQRQQALSMYVTLVVSLLAALVALKPGDQRQSIPVEWLVLGFPVASTFLAFLNFKAERAITNLRRFLSTLEQLNDAHLALPSYNTDPCWAYGANRARRFHDFAAAVLVAGGNAVALGAIIHIYPDRISQNPLMVWVTAIVALICVLSLLVTQFWSYRPKISP